MLPTFSILMLIKLLQVRRHSPDGGVGGVGAAVTSTVVVPFEASQLSLPLYAAVIVCVPVELKLVVYVDVPSIPTGTVVRRFEPSKKVMPRPPLGSPAQLTVALRSTDCPVAAVEGDAWTVVPEDTAAAAAGEAMATTASAAKANDSQAFRL
jgi:hypothetical protein